MKRILILILILMSCPLHAAQQIESVHKRNTPYDLTAPTHTPLQGRVIFITGSCSAGKSSIAQNLAQQLNAQYFAFDEYVMPIVTKKMVQKTVGKFLAFFISNLVVRNFFTFVGFLSEKTKYAFQKKFYAELEKGIAYEPTVKMYRAARAVALNGQNVIVEAPLHLGGNVDCLSSLSDLKDLDMTFVLAYCPWDQLVQRIEKRNTSPNKKIHRELDWAIGNFVHCFDVSTHYDKNAIDRVDGRVVYQALDVYMSRGNKKKRLSIMEETKKITLEHFPTDEIYSIYPRFSYDLVVNTSACNPVQGAARVMDFLRNDSHKKTAYA